MMKNIRLAQSGTKPFVKLLWLIVLVMVFTMVAGTISLLFKDNLLLSQATGTVVIFGGSALCYQLFFLPLDDVRKTFYFTGKWYFLLIAFALVFLSTPCIELISECNQKLSFSGDEAFRRIYQQSEQLTHSLCEKENIFLSITVMALLPAVFEEWFFRGVMQKFFIGWTRSCWTGIIITAAVFSLFHLDIFNFVSRLALGVILGFIYYYTGNIWNNIMYHFINNATVVVTYWLMGKYHTDFSLEDTFVASWWVAVLTLIIFSLLCWFVVRKHRENQLQSEEKDLTIEKTR